MTLKSFAVGVTLVAFGMLMGTSIPNAEASRKQTVLYALSAGSDSEVWRANVRTGEVSICENPFGAPNVPVCSPWSLE